MGLGSVSRPAGGARLTMVPLNRRVASAFGGAGHSRLKTRGFTSAAADVQGKDEVKDEG